MTYQIRAASKEDAAKIAPLLREADRQEIKAMTGCTPVVAIYCSILDSDEAMFVSRPDGHPIALIGIGKCADFGVPWMIGTDLLPHYGKSLVKHGREWVRQMTDKYGTLSNYVDARNTVHVNWLNRMGFTVTRNPEYIGYDTDVPFYPFYRSN